MSGEMRPAFWLQSLKTALEEAKNIPMWKGVFPFSWDRFGESLAESLGIDALKVAVSDAEWIEEGHFLESLGEKPYIQSIACSPIDGEVFLIIPRDDVLTLSEWVLTEKKEKEGLLDENVRKGFFTFSLLLALEAFLANSQYPLTPHLSSAPLPTEHCYALDISLKKGRKTIWARLLLPAGFQKSAGAFFAKEEPPLSMLAEENDIPLSPSLAFGHVALTQSEWKSLKKGDFVLLDYTSYTPGSNKGTFQLTLGATPLFQVKVKEGEIKILDYPIEFQEHPMDDEMYDEPLPEEAMATEEAEPSAPTEKLVAATSVPLKLTVELGQVSMSLKKLLSLKPGNVLETGIHPEKPVRLTVNGTAVAEGILTQVGDCVGVQITQIAKK